MIAYMEETWMKKRSRTFFPSLIHFIYCFCFYFISNALMYLLPNEIANTCDYLFHILFSMIYVEYNDYWFNISEWQSQTIIVSLLLIWFTAFIHFTCSYRIKIYGRVLMYIRIFKRYLLYSTANRKVESIQT